MAKLILLDMTCPSCGATSSASDTIRQMYVEKEGETKFGVYKSKKDINPIPIKCQYCGKESVAWIQGEKTKQRNSSSNVYIAGNVTGTHIVIGDNNKIG